jgi:acetoin utilization protein AcuB
MARTLLNGRDMQAEKRFHQFPTVSAYMTRSPLTVGREQSLTVAERMMRSQDVRHLPVLDAGHIVGVLSQRDCLLVESIAGTNPTEVRVEEAMVTDVFTASPQDPVADVVQTMVARKLGSAVITEADKVVGVFTTIDALGAFLDRLAE